MEFKEENFITGYVPGGEAMNLDSGIGFLIPKGSVLGLQIHFVSTGKAEKCRSRSGFATPARCIDQRLRQHAIDRPSLCDPARRPGAQGRGQPRAR